MDKGDRIAISVGLVLLGVMVLFVLLSVAGMMMMGQGERTVLGPAHASPSPSPTVSPSVTPPRNDLTTVGNFLDRTQSNNSLDRSGGSL